MFGQSHATNPNEIHFRSNGNTTYGVISPTGLSVTGTGSFGSAGSPTDGALNLYGGAGNTIFTLRNSTTGTASGDGSWIYIGAGSLALKIQNQEASVIDLIIGSTTIASVASTGLSVTGD